MSGGGEDPWKEEEEEDWDQKKAFVGNPNGVGSKRREPQEDKSGAAHGGEKGGPPHDSSRSGSGEKVSNLRQRGEPISQKKNELTSWLRKTGDGDCHHEENEKNKIGEE